VQAALILWLDCLDLRLVFTATVIDCGPLSGDPMQLARFESDSLFQAAKIIRTFNPVNVKSAADGIPLGHVRIIVITVLKVSKLCKLHQMLYPIVFSMRFAGARLEMAARMGDLLCVSQEQLVAHVIYVTAQSFTQEPWS